MKFTISRDALLKPLNLVAGVVERRQTLPILANVLMVLDEDRLALTGTDLEVELVGRVQLAAAGDSATKSTNAATISARKGYSGAAISGISSPLGNGQRE